MRNFSTPSDVARLTGQQPIVAVRTTAPRVRETVTVTPTVAVETRTTDIGQAPGSWSVEDLAAYVVRKITEIHGPFPMEPYKIKGIFQGFLRRHGSLAGPIAVSAFTEHGGRWRGAPISVTRFCLNSDEFFADPIKKRLAGN